MKKIINTQPQNQLTISYWPTDICNFSCDYCFPYNLLGKYRYPKDIDKVLQGFEKLFDVYKHKRKETFKLEVSGGGEPTVWPKLGEFCKEIKNLADVEIQLVTNGSRSLRWWKKYYDCIDSVALSFHQKDVDINHYIDVADFLYDNGLEVNGVVLMDPLYWEKCVENLEYLLKNSKSWFVHTKEIIGRDYTKDQLDFLKNSFKRLADSHKLLKYLDDYNIVVKSIEMHDNTARIAKLNHYVNEGTNKWKDWKCWFPIEKIAIDTNGDIVGSCATSITNSTCNLYDNDLDIKLKNISYVTCPKLSCDCIGDTHITKEKIS